MDLATGAGSGLGGVEPPHAAARRPKVAMMGATVDERAM
jgi:hypothetical protein